MKLTPELLTLLKHLLDICVQEVARAKETEQTYEQIQIIVLQIRKILDSM